MSRSDPTTDAAPHGPDRRFAVLEHRWDGVHWDFLVEDGPTLRTWAVAEPIRPDSTIPARELAPHRRVYLDYEGPIAEDRGEVRRWDGGTARVEVWTEAEVRLQLRGDQLLGTVRLWRVEGGAGVEPAGGWLFRLGKLS